ncbi:MAG: response regulator [Spirochaetaceae bacterium]|jgi:two-component system chemotaxis response regulator CheY|nr:response regulator [Spirochaetaceae bacterium]
MTILVVDDSRIQRNIIRSGLQDYFGHNLKIFEAANGLSAENMLPTLKPDLLLLDWNMPELNGLDLVKRIRKKEEFKSLPVIMITSESAKYNVIEAIKSGVNDYLVKPVSSQGLIAKIKRLNIGV